MLRKLPSICDWLSMGGELVFISQWNQSIVIITFKFGKYIRLTMCLSVCLSVFVENIIVVQFITMTSQWARWRLKSPASRLFTQVFIQTQIKENIKALRHWPLWGEFTGDRWMPRTKGQKMFPFDNIIMSFFLRLTTGSRLSSYF